MRFRFITSETFKGLTRNLAMTISVVLVSFVSLLFVGASSLLQSQIAAMKGEWYDKIEVSVYMCPSDSSSAVCIENGEATQEQIAAVAALIDSGSLAPFVKSYTIESKAEAYARFQRAFGDQALGRIATEDMMPKGFINSSYFGTAIVSPPALFHMSQVRPQPSVNSVIFCRKPLYSLPGDPCHCGRSTARTAS